MAVNSAQQGGPAATSANGASTGSTGVTRNPSFRIALPAASTASSNGAISPGNGASSPGATTSNSLFGGLNRGFRRNRGHSTTRDNGSNNNNLPPSPPASSTPSFPALGASVSHQDQLTQNYFDGDHYNAANTNNNTSQLSSSIPASSSLGSTSGARGIFARRGFARKMTGGNRTPTSEAPPLLRSRSSSQPTQPANVVGNANNTPQNPATATGSFFPPQAAAGSANAASSSTATNDAVESRRPVTAGAIAPTASSTANAAAPATTSTSTTTTSSSAVQHIRLVPHLESTRSLTFEPVSRDVVPTIPLRIGRFTDRNPSQPISAIDQHRVAFKSKVVSRTHAEIWYDTNPTSAYNGTTNTQTSSTGWFIRDLKSSSGTFLNHIRLSGAGMESRPFPLRDGDLLQLGVDYQGGTEEIYRCVKMRVELNRGWQRQANSFNTNALRQIRALGNVSDTAPGSGDSANESATNKKSRSKRPTSSRKDTLSVSAPAKKPPQQASGVTDCCICLYSVTVYQALFIAPCSHIFHFKCIYPLLTKHHPGFECPLCRTFADLEADVEQDDVVEAVEEEEEEASDESEEDVENEEEEAIARARATGEAKLLPDIPSDETGLAAAVAAISTSESSLDPSASTSIPEAQVVQDTLASTSNAFVHTESAEDAALHASNLETLRPGRKSPMIQQLPSQIQPREESTFPGQSAEDASIVNYGTSTPRVTTNTRRTSNHTSARASLEEGLPSSSGAFYPPSAGDFDPDMRRTSIFVQGADGHAMSIPVTGRSRPGSLYDMDMSDSNINPHGSSSASPVQQNNSRARSVKGLRMSKGSRTSLRDSTSSMSNMAASQAIAADTNVSSSGGPSSASMVHSRTGTEYHDSADHFASDDEDWEVPLTAAGPATSHPSELEASPTSVFTAPLAALSPETQPLGSSISPIQSLNLGQSLTPSATPSSRSVDDLNDSNVVDVKGKGVAQAEENEGSEGSASGSSDVGIAKRLINPTPRQTEGASA